MVDDDGVESAPTAGELSRMPIPALFAGARAEVVDDDRDGPVPYLVALHLRPIREVFDAAAHLLSDDDPIARELGAPPAWLRARAGVLGWAISALGYNSAREALSEDVAPADKRGQTSRRWSASHADTSGPCA